MHFISMLLPAIEHFHSIGYWLALLIALLETTVGLGLFIPGSTIILFMGALAANGYFNLGDLIWFVIIGAVIGDNINYFIGKKYSSKIFTNNFWFIRPTYFEKGKTFFKHHGSKSIFIGRFIPSIKEIIPLIAGALHMKHSTFLVWNILGAIGWSLLWILPGYFFAQSLDLAKIWLTRAGFLLIIFLIIFIIFYIIKIIFIKKGKKIFSFITSIWQSIKQAIIQNSEIQKFITKHQKFLKFLKNRLDKNSFYGLPLTLLFLALLYALFLFGGITKSIINSEVIITADVRAANLLTIFRNTNLTTFFVWITLIGKWQIILIFASTTSFILWLWKKQSYIIPLFLSIIGSETFVFIEKIIFHRARPKVALYHESSFSFPSGHATIAIAFYGFLTYLLIKKSLQWKRKINIFFISFILIILIGFSRLYLGVHYISDVWAGYLTGTIWLIIAISFSEYLLSKKQSINIITYHTKKRLVTIGIILISISLYIIFALNYKIPFDTNIQNTNHTTVNNVMDIFKTKQLKYTETLVGKVQEPLSLIIVAKNDQQLINLFKQAGWALADDINFKNTIHLAQAALWKEAYLQAPMTPDFWNSKVHTFGFEKETASNSVRIRHHARFWKTTYFTANGQTIYVGTASFDNGIKWIVTHHISSDIDTERELLLNDLQKTNLIVAANKQQFVNPHIGTNFSGDLFFTDGKIYLIYTK